MAKDDERVRKIEDRPLSLVEEVKYHCLMWKNDFQFKKTNKFVKDAIENVLDSISIASSMKAAEVLNSSTDDKALVEAKRYIAIYKQRYFHLADFDCEESVSNTTFIIIKRHCEKLLEQMSNAEEYLAWFYDDFLEENKKLCPPNMNLSISNFVVKKFMFKMKDTLKVRKKDTVNSRKRISLMKVAVELFDATTDEEFGQMLMKFGNNRISYPKAEKYIRDYAETNGFVSVVEKLKVLSNEK